MKICHVLLYFSKPVNVLYKSVIVIPDENNLAKGKIANIICRGLTESLDTDQKPKEIHIVDINNDFLPLLHKKLQKHINRITDNDQNILSEQTEVEIVDRDVSPESPTITTKSAIQPVTDMDENILSEQGEMETVDQEISRESPTITPESAIQPVIDTDKNIQSEQAEMETVDQEIAAEDPSIITKSAIEPVSESHLQSAFSGEIPSPEITTATEKHVDATFDESVSIPDSHLPCGFLTLDVIKVFIHKCDITTLRVDAVVNVTSEKLDHESAFSNVIFDAAGPELEREIRKIINNSGPIPVTQTVVTSAGKLPCKSVIHAVGPHWPLLETQEKKEHCLMILRDTFANIVHTADTHGFNSIALPALFSGKIHFLSNVCFYC